MQFLTGVLELILVVLQIIEVSLKLKTKRR